MAGLGKMNLKVIFGLFLVHFIGDFYMSFVTPLLPVLADNMSLTLTQVGLLTGISRVMAFVVQPTVGYLADRHRNRLFVLGGPLIAMIFIPLLGVADSFWLAVAIVSLGSLGTSMFHPTAAAMVADHSGGRVSFAMSLFGTGGTVAFAAGPLFVSWYVSTLGLAALPYTSIIGLATMALLLFMVPRPQGEGLSHMGFWGSIKTILGDVWQPILLLWLLVVLRTFVSQSFFTFGLFHFADQGHSLVSLGAIVASFTTAGALSGLLSGHLADRYGFRPVILVSYALTTPCLYLFLIADSTWIYAASFVTGFVVMATMPVIVAMAQTLAPRGKSMASSLMMGLAFGVGGMLTPITGRLADLYGIITVLEVVMWLPLAAIGLVLVLPRIRIQ